MFRLFKVRGESMIPTLMSGDIVLLRRCRARSGDVVVVDHHRYGAILKRIGPNGHLIGDGPESTPSDELGPYKPSTLIGVAVLVITPQGLRHLPASRSGTRA